MGIFIGWLQTKIAQDEDSADNVILTFYLMERKHLGMPYPDDFDCKLDDDCVYGYLENF
jgi:hypothetical protein